MKLSETSQPTIYTLYGLLTALQENQERIEAAMQEREQQIACLESKIAKLEAIAARLNQSQSEAAQ